MKPHIHYEFHHMGIPTNDHREGEVFSAAAGMFTSDNPGKFRIQWHRYTETSSLHLLVRTAPHPALKVANLQDAIEAEELLLGPYEPIDGYFVAMINDNGVLIELIQTDLTDREIWERARTGQGVLYRENAEPSAK